MLQPGTQASTFWLLEAWFSHNFQYLFILQAIFRQHLTGA